MQVIQFRSDFSRFMIMRKNRIILVIFGILYSISIGVIAAEKNLWQQSINLERQGEYAKAAGVIEPLLNKEKIREHTLLRYAWLAYQQRNYNDSIRYYKQALELNPASFDARFGLSLPLLARAEWKKAEIYLHQITAISPWNYTAHIRLFACEEGLRKWKQLATHAEAFSRLYPSDATALVYLARAKNKLEDKEAAKETYLQVLIRVPEHIEAINYVRNFQYIPGVQ